MAQFLALLAETSEGAPPGATSQWTAGYGWLHVVSDLGLWSACVVIAMLFFYSLSHRGAPPFRVTLLLVGASLLASATAHLMEAVLFWGPAYLLSGLLKLVATVGSWAAVVAMARAVPRAMAPRGRDELEHESDVHCEESPAQANAESGRQIAALRASEERFRLLVEGAKEYAIFLLDPAGHVASWNPGAERIKQYRAGEIIGRHFSTFYPPEDVRAGKPQRELEVAAAGGKCEDEGWRLRKDGTRFFANVVITALRDDAGTLRGFSKLTRDITEKQQAEENVRRLLQEEAARRAAEDAADAIRAQREHLLVTLQSIGDGVIATDGAGRVTLLNPVAEALAGWASRDAAGRPLDEVFHIVNEMTRHEVENPVARVLREGVVVGLANHTVLLARDGSERPIDDSAAPIKDQRGNILGVILIFRDASEQRGQECRRAARLAVTGALAGAHTVEAAAPIVLRGICENLGWKVGALWVVDPAARQLRCVHLWQSPSLRGDEFARASRATCFQPGAGLPGRVWSSAEPAWVADVENDASFPRAEAAARQGLRGAFAFPVQVGGEVRGVLEFFSDRVRQPDPDVLEMARTIGALLGEFLDRLRREAEVQHSAEVSRFLAGASAALAGIVDYESTLQKLAQVAVPYFSDWCAVDMLGADGCLRQLAMAHADPAKVRLADQVRRRRPPDPAAPTGVWHVLRSGQPELIADIADDLLVAVARGEDDLLQIMREQGLKSCLRVPLRVRSKVVGVLTFVTADSGRRFAPADLSVALDLADRAGIAIDNALLYGELREAARRKDEFLAMLAHELRNPLAPLVNAVQIMRLAGDDRAAMDRARSLMERQLQQMVRLVDDLLDVSRITRGKVELRRQRAELAAVIQTAVETSRPLIAASRHDLTLSLPAEPLVVDCDVTRLAQVFSNLFNNAAKYTEPGGHISLTAERRENEAVVTVRDTGVGIPGEMLKRVFDLFTQVDRSRERAQGGLGIGLTLVQRLVELHGGSVEAQSEGPGRGSAFVVRLPLAPSKDAVDAVPAPPPPPRAGPSPPRRILVVDDNVDAAQSLATLLRLGGHEVRVTHDGPAALSEARAFVPEVVLLDIGMPGMDGYEVARRLRRAPETNGALLVAQTGWGQDEDHRRSREAGFAAHLVKPLDPDALEQLLARERRPG
jgi:PAS domain S-box-containing protein